MRTMNRRSVRRIGLFALATILALGLYMASTALAGRPVCWMTGGGSIFALNGVDTGIYAGQLTNDGRITHGFVVHCVPRNSDNLEIVDHATGQKFHMLSLDNAICTDDPEITPNPPNAGFDTFTGFGTGRCNDRQACTVEFVFKDGGEPGGCIRDYAQITVRDLETGDVVFSINGAVDCGNNQAHSQY